MRWNLWIAFMAVVLLIPLWLYEQKTAVPTTNVPQFSHPAGHYTADFVLHIESPDPTAVVVLTHNGAEPTAEDTHDQPLWMHGPRVAVLRARLYWPATDTLGPIVTHHYLVALASRIPVLSLAAVPADLWDPTTGIYPNFLQRGAEWERPAHLLLYDPTVDWVWQTNHTIAIHGTDSRRLAKKSWRLYFRGEEPFRPNYLLIRNEQEMVASIFGLSAPHTFRQWVVAGGGQDGSEFATNWTLLRQPLLDELTRDVLGYGVRSRPVLLFINGELWGVYLLRERFDERLLEQGLLVERPQLLDSPALEESLGSAYRAWQGLLDYVNITDMSQPQAMAQVATQMDVENFIDYHIVQFYAAPAAWPALNYQMFRPNVPGGRWHWYFWDTGDGLGVRPANPALPMRGVEEDMLAAVLAIPPTDLGAAHAQLFQRLWLNEGFRTQFYQRANELLATQLSAAQMEARLDRLAAEVAPAMLYEMSRWPHQSHWEQNTAELRAFIRQRPEVLRQQWGLEP